MLNEQKSKPKAPYLGTVPPLSKPASAPTSPEQTQTAPPVASSTTTDNSNPSEGPNTPPQPNPIRSSMALSEWQGSLTTFRGFTGTLPEKELLDASWNEIANLLCPDTPAILQNKQDGQYVVPCALQEEPFVGATLEAAKRDGKTAVGKMRSKNHVTEAAMIFMDVDGVQEEEFSAANENMKADDITSLAHSTHSHGHPDKPGMHVRLVIPIDRALPNEEYRAAWKGLNDRHFGGKADPSGANIYQQQGTWCCHPDRVDQARSWRHDAGVASADALIKLGGGVEPPKPAKAVKKDAPVPAEGTYPSADANKIAERCQQLRNFRDNKGAGQSEPLWFDCIGVTAHCVNGENISQDWSSGHSGYDEAETAKKIAHRMNKPPTTCAHFRAINPEACKGCTEKCNSPISLGYDSADALAVVQRHFGLLNLNGKIWIYDRVALAARSSNGTANRLVLSNRSDGGLLIARYLRSAYPDVDAAKVVKEILFDPGTVCYSGIEFNPAGTSGKFLNLWVGPTIDAVAGDWSLIKSFLLDVICDGDQAAYDYLIRYIAHALQRPEDKPGVMIILIGGQGIGKGTLGRILQKIWSATYIQVNNIDAITGSFNAILERGYIVFMDEALFAGDRRSSDALKSIVTEPIIHINEKHQPARQIRSYHRIIAATNAAHFKNTDRDDRRDFTLRVSEAHKDDFAYWDALHHEIDHGGVQAMAHDLLAIDLSGFNVRDKPNTKEFMEQKLLSLEPVARWWYDFLVSGALDDAWPEFIGTVEIIEKVWDFSGHKLFRKPTAVTVAQDMKKLCPGAVKQQKQDNLSRVRGFVLPPLEQARAEFEQYIGGPVNWTEED